MKKSSRPNDGGGFPAGTRKKNKGKRGERRAPETIFELQKHDGDACIPLPQQQKQNKDGPFIYYLNNQNFGKDMVPLGPDGRRTDMVGATGPRPDALVEGDIVTRNQVDWRRTFDENCQYFSRSYDDYETIHCFIGYDGVMRQIYPAVRISSLGKPHENRWVQWLETRILDISSGHTMYQ